MHCRIRLCSITVLIIAMVLLLPISLHSCSQVPSVLDLNLGLRMTLKACAVCFIGAFLCDLVCLPGLYRAQNLTFPYARSDRSSGAGLFCPVQTGTTQLHSSCLSNYIIGLARVFDWIQLAYFLSPSSLREQQVVPGRVPLLPQLGKNSLRTASP